MRLINARTLELESFVRTDKPQYAILSHTWSDENDDEVTFQDMALPAPTSKKGWDKIIRTCSMALAEGLEFAWVDTCCIDKSSSAELSEAINSMFDWYRSASVCYVFLSDLDSPGHDSSDLLKCRWWARGWTLQELLAPSTLRFYDRNWLFRGSKEELAFNISQSTGIPIDALMRPITDVLHPFPGLSIATRMSWAAERNTTRVEDEAYCLLGIFGVNMPLLYGEGRRAFQRLIEEIIKRSNDNTVFAHSCDALIANSSRQFAGFGHLTRDRENDEFLLTNKGLKLIETNLMWLSRPYRLVLRLGGPSVDRRSALLFLKQIGPRLFYKDPDLRVQHNHTGHYLGEYIGSLLFTDIYIIPDPSNVPHILDSLVSRKVQGLQICLPDSFSIGQALPRVSFNHETLYFSNWVARKSAHDLICAMSFHIDRSLLALFFVLYNPQKQHHVLHRSSDRRFCTCVSRGLQGRTFSLVDVLAGLRVEARTVCSSLRHSTDSDRQRYFADSWDNKTKR